MQTLKKLKTECASPVRYSPPDYFEEPCETGDLRALEIAITAMGLDVNERTSKGKTPLYIACRHGQIAAFYFLVENGADVKHTNLFSDLQIRGNTCLIGASKGGHHELINHLVRLAGVDVNGPGIRNRTALHYAAKGGHLNAVICLIENGASVNEEDVNGSTPLALACEQGHLEIVKTLVRNGAYIFETPPASKALCAACQEGYLDIVKFLVAEAKIDCPNLYYGFDALTVASYYGKLEVVRFLIQNGAHITEGPDEYSTIRILDDNSTAQEAFGGPLSAACNRGHLDIAKYLIAAGCEVARKDENGHYPLSRAALGGQFEAVRLLIEGGAVTSDLEDPLLCAAVIADNRQLTKFLIDQGASVNAKDYCGKTPLYIACEENKPDQVKLLLEHGADPLEHEELFTNAIHAAIQSESLELVKEVTKGLSPKEIDTHYDMGFSPLIYAMRGGQFDIVKFLVEEKKADTNIECYVFRMIDRGGNESSWEVAFAHSNGPDILFPLFIQTGNLPTRSIFARMSARNQVPVLSKRETFGFVPNPLFFFIAGKAFFETWKIPSLNLLLAAREKNPESPFSKEYLPLDMFKEIFRATRQACLEFEWNSRYGEQENTK